MTVGQSTVRTWQDEVRDEVQIPADIIERAQRSVRRMVAIGKPAGAR